MLLSRRVLDPSPADAYMSAGHQVPGKAHLSAKYVETFKERMELKQHISTA